MTTCLFVSDLHGNLGLYEKLLDAVATEMPEAVFLGGDILPSDLRTMRSIDFTHEDFINGFLVKEFSKLKRELKKAYPRMFIILGNDDGRFAEASILAASTSGIWTYAHGRRIYFKRWSVYGYSYVPPTPFLLKDWERYDVSRYVAPGVVSPEEGNRSFPISEYESKYSTIKEDLELLVDNDFLGNAVFLFHSPPYETNLDRAALDGKKIDHAPLDVHVGSIAIRRFIEKKQPLLTLHGHVHESARITGSWKDKIGRTYSFSAAHDGDELALIRFELEDLGAAIRFLI
jgi:Icc-related predicted phosphoesterase